HLSALLPHAPSPPLFPYTTLFRSLTMNERVTVKRSIYPQANLKSLGATLRDLIERGKIDRSLLVQEVTLGSAWFASRQVTAHALDRKSTRLNSSHVSIAYGVFCLK